MEFLKDVKKKEEKIEIPINENTLEDRLKEQQKKHDEFVKMQQQTGQNVTGPAQTEKNKQTEKIIEAGKMQDPLIAVKTDEKAVIGNEELAVQTPIEKLLFEADNFAPRIGMTNSYALKMVKRQLLDLKRISEDKTDGERDIKLRFSVLQLKEACERYKAVKFKNGEKPKNWRHEKVATILEAAEKELKKNPIAVDETINAKHAEIKEKLDGINSDSVNRIKESYEDVRGFLKNEIPDSTEKLNMELYRLKEVYYQSAINYMETYLKKHISWSLENERRYLIVHDTITALKLEYEKISKLDHKKLKELRKGGAKTYEDVLLKNWDTFVSEKTIKKTVKKIAEKNDAETKTDSQVKNIKAVEEPLESEELVKDNIDVSAFAECIGSEVYKKTYVKDGNTVYDNSTPYSMKDILDYAKEQKLPVMYSDGALMQLREAQIIDYILGIKNRSEDSLGYSFSHEVYQGNAVIMIDKVRLMDNAGAFSEEGAEGGFTVPNMKFNMAYHVEKPKRERFKKKDEDLKKRIADIGIDKIEEALKNTGTVLTDAQKKKLEDRINAVKLAFTKDYAGAAKYINNDLIIEKKQVYNQNKLLEEEVNKLTGKRAEHSKEKDKADIVLTHSSELRLKSKERIRDAAIRGCNGNNDFRMIRKITNEDGSITERDYINEIRDLMLYYSSLDEHAEKTKSGKFIGQSKRKAYNKLRDVENYSMAKDLFGGYDQQDETDDEYVESFTGYEGLLMEKNCLKDLFSVIDEYKAIIERKLALGDKVEQDTEYSVIEKKIKKKKKKDGEKEAERKEEEVEREKDSKKIGLWRREKQRLERLESELKFTKGVLIAHPNLRKVNDEHFTYYRKTEDGEKGIIDQDGKEQPYVLLDLVDRSDEPLFLHEPCIEDVLQGGLGDCFLIGTLASIVDKNPLFIKDMMKENPDNTVTVKLYDPKKKEVLITVKKTVPVDYSRGALWVKLIEKAYTASGLFAEYKQEFGSPAEAESRLKDTQTSPSRKRDAQMVLDYHNVKDLAKKAPGAPQDADGCLYESIESGDIDLAFRLLTGNSTGENYGVIGDVVSGSEAVKVFLDQSKEEIMKTYGKEIDDIIETIEIRQKDEKNKYIFVAGSYPYLYVSELEGENSANAYRSGIAGPHLYSLLGVEERGGKKMVRLRNPWGNGKVHYITQGESGRKIPVLGDDTDTGAFLIHVEDFASCFKEVSMIKLTNEKN